MLAEHCPNFVLQWEVQPRTVPCLSYVVLSSMAKHHAGWGQAAGCIVSSPGTVGSLWHPNQSRLGDWVCTTRLTDQLDWHQRDAMPAKEHQHRSAHSCGCHAAKYGLQQQQSSSSAGSCAGCRWLVVPHAASVLLHCVPRHPCKRPQKWFEAPVVARQYLSMLCLCCRKGFRPQQRCFSACHGGHTADEVCICSLAARQ